MTATGGTRRLGVDGEDAVPGLDQRREYRRGKARRAHVNKVEGLSRGRGGQRSTAANPALGGRENSAALCLGELAQDHPTLDEGQVVDKQNTVEVFNLVL